MQQTLDQYAIAQRKISVLNTELEECKNALDNAIRARRQAEVDLEEANAKVNDLTSINANLTSIKGKLESELQITLVWIKFCKFHFISVKEKEKNGKIPEKNGKIILKSTFEKTEIKLFHSIF